MTVTLDTGDAAPNFDLPSDGGGGVALAALKGKKVLLYFYPKDDTSGCTAEAIAFNGLLARFKAANTIVVGVSPDPPQRHVKFKAKHGLKIPLLSDESKAALEAYGVWVKKSMYGRKYMGVERSTFLIGPDGRIARVWRKVKVAGHAEEALAAAQEL